MKRYVKKRSHTGLIKLFLIICILTAVFIAFVHWRVRPVISSVAAVQAKSFAVSAVNKAAADVLSECDIPELEEVSSDSSGSLRSVTTNTAAANELKHRITLRAQQEIGRLNHQRVDIPAGLILGGELFGGVGPDIPVYISLSGNADSDFEESFESGGINQTVHKLSLRINVQLSVLTPSGSINENTTTSVLIGETVIIGNTPQGVFGTDITD